MPFCSFVTLKLISKPSDALESRMYVNLCLMDWKKRFDDEIAAYEQIDPIAAIEQEILVTNGQRQLHLKRDTRVRELTSQAPPVGPFE